MVAPRTDALAAAGLPRATTVGGVEWIVRAPTVREAVEVFTILRESLADPETEALLDPVLRRWWGDPAWSRPPSRVRRIWNRLTRRGPVFAAPVTLYAAWLDAPYMDRVDALGGLLFAGVDLPDKDEDPGESPAGDDSETDQVKDPATWEAMIGSYVEAFGGDPWTLYNSTPFPFFVSMYGTAARQLALRSLRELTATSLPYAGDEGPRVVADLERAAGLKRAKRQKSYGGRAPKEVIDANQRRLLAMVGGVVDA